MVETSLTYSDADTLSPTNVTIDWNERDEPSLVRDAIIDDLSVESKPTGGYVLPETDSLVAAVTAVEQYLYSYGAAFLDDLYLDGLAGVVTYTGSKNIHAVVDTDAFNELVETIVTESSGVDVSKELVSAVSFAFELESKRRFQTHNDTVAEADWAEVGGQQTNDTVSLVVETPHPLIEINTHRSMYDRAVGVVAGIQQLTHDIDGVFGQRDTGVYVLYRALIGSGESELQARQTVMSFYGVNEDAFHGLIQTVEEAVYDSLHDEDYDLEFRYNMPERVTRQLV